MIKPVTIFAPIALVAVLGACSGSSNPDYLASCMFDVNAKGQYQSAAVDVPVVGPVPGTGATQSGADALNACIRAKAR